MSPKPSKALYATEDAQFIIQDHLHYGWIAPDRMSVENHYLGVNPVLVYSFAGRVLKEPPVS